MFIYLCLSQICWRCWSNAESAMLSLRPLTYRMMTLTVCTLTWNVVQQCDNRRVDRDANNATGVWAPRLHGTHDWSCATRRRQCDVCVSSATASHAWLVMHDATSRTRQYNSNHLPRGHSHILTTTTCTLTWKNLMFDLGTACLDMLAWVSINPLIDPEAARVCWRWQRFVLWHEKFHDLVPVPRD